jgi:superfamily I DNA/RNA helicase
MKVMKKKLLPVSIMCSTVHRAKGLESENVFLLEGTFKGLLEQDEEGEEQNIVYVAVTRSKQRLWRVSGFERKSKKEAA